MFTDEQQQEFKKILEQVSVSAICKKKRFNKKPIRTATIWEVLRGAKNSPQHIKVFKIVLNEARKQIARRAEEIQSL